MLILGKSNDDKGKQLEQIMGAMLGSRGYRNIRFNTTAAGGAEYDVSGELLFPSVGRARARRVKIVGECKARKDPANMTDWQKFLGKVFLEEIKRSESVTGVFVSISGYNSAVASSFEEVSQRRSNIELVGETDINEFLLEEYSVCSLSEVAAMVARSTQRTASSLELCYYARRCYWLVAFEKGAYTLFDATGDPLRGDALGDVRELVETITALDKFVDLQEEAEARQRSRLTQKEVLARLMLWGGAADEEQLFGESPLSRPPSKEEIDKGAFPFAFTPPDPPFEADELAIATVELVERGWIERASESASDDVPDSVSDVVRFKKTDDRCANIVEILRFWLNEGAFLISLYAGLLSRFYDEHVDARLLDDILKIQGDLPLSPSEREEVIRVLKLSPQALNRALHPIEMITNHRLDERQSGPSDMIDQMDRNIFFENLSAGFVDDCRSQMLAAYYCGTRGILELEQCQSVIAKNATGIDTKIEWRSRYSVRPSNVKGGFIHLLVPDDGLEPWEELNRRAQCKPETIPNPPSVGGSSVE